MTAPKRPQKYQTGARVRIKVSCQREGHKNKRATVIATYAQLHGGTCYSAYKLDIDGVGCVDWFDEQDLDGVKE